MDRRFKIRLLIVLSIWLPLAIFSSHYAWKQVDSPRFEFLLSSVGAISSLQREDWLQSSLGLRPHDQILTVNDLPFEQVKVREWLSHQKVGQKVDLKIRRGDQEIDLSSSLRRYSKNDLLILFFIPLFLSLIFLGFALGVSNSRSALIRSKEAVEVFSAICFSVSIFFLILLPATTLGSSLSFSVLLPFLGVLVMHLFLVYPKKKGPTVVRHIFLGAGYFLVFALALIRASGRSHLLGVTDHVVQNLGTPFFGFCILVALGSLANTLLTSRDFWARRRARLLSLVLLVSFVAGLSVFWALLWEVPRLSVERILAVSLIFPSAFAGIFLKENVFNLERIFKRGMHQLLLLGMATTFALLLGLGWNAVAPDRQWTLWVAIAIVVLMVARPVGNFFEDKIHRWIQTKVRYPKVNELFERASSRTNFLHELAKHFESHLNMKNISFVFFQDPTHAWSPSNEQVWLLKAADRGDSELIRTYSNQRTSLYFSTMYRGDAAIGEIRFDGGDALAFDPYFSRDWSDTVRDISRCLEILCLREFISIQQGFLAVGRMQSLLAHQMKNPLAIIKVCAGLLNSHIRGNEEAEELAKTIQGEVGRVAAAIQGVFEHSSRVETKQKIHLGDLLAAVKESALARFSGRNFEVTYWSDGLRDDSLAVFGIWSEKEGLRQTLSNLVVNAFEAGSSSVFVEVHFSKREFSLVVKDNGPGLHEKIDLFKPFVTTKSHGTGLGLAHVKAFMDRNSGSVKVHSKPGEGSSFVLEFSKQSVMNESL